MADVLMMSLSTDSFLPQLTLEFFNFMEFFLGNMLQVALNVEVIDNYLRALSSQLSNTTFLSLCSSFSSNCMPCIGYYILF